MNPGMFSARKGKSVVGLDIEAGSIAATEVRANGSIGLGHNGIAELGPDVVKEGEVLDAAALGEALRSLFSSQKLPKAVRLGIANQRVAVRTLRLPVIEDPEELATAVRFQAEEHIPMPIDQAVVDFQVVGYQDGEGVRTMDVIVVAARRDMLEAQLQALRVAGLRPVGIDLSAFGMIRALATGPPEEVVAYCHIGDVTNLAVARGRSCLFTRISPFGTEPIAERLAEREGMALSDARALLLRAGAQAGDASDQPPADADPAVVVAREALSEGISRLADELRLSLDFYEAQDNAAPVLRVILCGPGSAIPGLAGGLSEHLGHPCEAARPAPLAELGDAPAARLTLSYGLALED
jgi:type IV pilus assembly protein PilM